MIFRGSAVALVTPFCEDGSVDFDSYEKLLDFHLKNETDAVVAIGTTGEAITMTEEERLDIVKLCVDKLKGKKPVIIGVGNNDTEESADFAKKASALSPDAILVITPYYNKCNQEGLYRHFKTIAERSSVPVILYTVPSRTTVEIKPQTAKRLCEIDNIVGIKDATGNLGYTAKLRNILPDDFAIYSGNDDVAVPVLAMGGDGVISVSANILPNETHKMCQAFFDGDIYTARVLQLKMLNMINSMFAETNPIPVKAAMKLMGLPAGHYRLPLCEPSEETVRLLEKNMKELNLI